MVTCLSPIQISQLLVFPVFAENNPGIPTNHVLLSYCRVILNVHNIQLFSFLQLFQLKKCVCAHACSQVLYCVCMCICRDQRIICENWRSLDHVGPEGELRLLAWLSHLTSLPRVFSVTVVTSVFNHVYIVGAATVYLRWSIDFTQSASFSKDLTVLRFYLLFLVSSDFILQKFWYTLGSALLLREDNLRRGRFCVCDTKGIDPRTSFTHTT